MNCEEVTQRLPWLMNGTLEGEERAQVWAHLAQCPRCPLTLPEAVKDLAVFQQHVPTENLTDYAFDPRMEPAERALIEHHVQMCRTCTQELALLRESRRRMEEDAPVAEARLVVTEPAWRGRAQRWFYAAVAAGLAGMIAWGGWWWTWDRAERQQTEWQAQVEKAQKDQAGLAAEIQALRADRQQAEQKIATLAAQLQEREAPQLNIPIWELYSTGQSIRQLPTTQPQVLEIPPGAQEVTLILQSESPATYSDYRVEIVNAQQQVVWSNSGLRRLNHGYTLRVPIHILPKGRGTIRVYIERNGAREYIDNYPIRIK